MSPAIRATQFPVQSVVAGNSLHDSDTGQPPISVRSLSRSFGSAQALDHVDFDVPQGAIYALVGRQRRGEDHTRQAPAQYHSSVFRYRRCPGEILQAYCRQCLYRIGYVSENQELPDWMTVTQLLSYLHPFYPQWSLLSEQAANAAHWWFA